MTARSAFLAAIISIFGLGLLSGCVSNRRPRGIPSHVEVDIALDGIEEVPGVYSQSDGFWSVSYTIVRDGTFERRFIPDDLGQWRESDTIRGKWRLLDRQTVETEWKDPNGITRSDKLHFVAVDRKLGFVEMSHRRELESRRVDWRSRIFIFVKYEPNPVPTTP